MPLDFQPAFLTLALCLAKQARGNVHAGQIKSSAGKFERDTAIATWHVENPSRGRILARGFEKVGIAHRLVARHDRLPEIEEDAREVFAPPSAVLVLAGVVRHPIVP